MRYKKPILVLILLIGSLTVSAQLWKQTTKNLNNKLRSDATQKFTDHSLEKLSGLIAEEEEMLFMQTLKLAKTDVLIKKSSKAIKTNNISIVIQKGALRKA